MFDSRMKHSNKPKNRQELRMAQQALNCGYLLGFRPVLAMG